MIKFDGDPAEAEADLRRASQALIEAEDDLAEAVERAEALEDEPYDGTPEAAAEISRRMDVIQREIITLQERVADAEAELHSTNDHWVDRGYLPS